MWITNRIKEKKPVLKHIIVKLSKIKQKSWKQLRQTFARGDISLDDSEPGRADADYFFRCGKKELLSFPKYFIFRKMIFQDWRGNKHIPKWGKNRRISHIRPMFNNWLKGIFQIERKWGKKKFWSIRNEERTTVTTTTKKTQKHPCIQETILLFEFYKWYLIMEAKAITLDIQDHGAQKWGQ